MNRYVADLKRKYPVDMPELNYRRVSGRNVEIKEIVQELSAVPFFSRYRFLVITEPVYYTVEKTRYHTDEIAALTDALTKTADDFIVVLYLEGKFDERRRDVKALRKAATYRYYAHPGPVELKEWALKALKQRNVDISDEALELLLKRAGGTLEQLFNEINKLALYGDFIDIETAKVLVTRPLEDNALALSNALLKKDGRAVFAIYQDLKVNNIEPVRLIALLASSVRLLYQVKLLDGKGYNDQEIAKMLSVNPNRLYYVRKDMVHYSLADLKKLLTGLSRLDVDIKQGAVEKYQGMELFFLNTVMRGEEHGIAQDAL